MSKTLLIRIKKRKKKIIKGLIKIIIVWSLLAYKKITAKNSRGRRIKFILLVANRHIL